MICAHCSVRLPNHETLAPPARRRVQAEVIAALMERTDTLMRDHSEGSSRSRELAEANNVLRRAGLIGTEAR